MSNLIDIQTQIGKLQKQANDIKAKEFDKTVQDMLSTMQAFGITVKDLQAASVRAGKSKRSASGKQASKRAKSAAGKTVAAKFRGPNGETWSGRGLTPRWLAALLAQGQTKEDFVIKS